MSSEDSESVNQEQKSISPALADYFELVRQRTLLTETEQAVERIIYDPQMLWNSSAISAFLSVYETAKNDRAVASLAVAEAYMQLSPRERAIADERFSHSADAARRRGDQ